MSAARDELRKALHLWRMRIGYPGGEQAERDRRLDQATEAVLSEPEPDPDARLRELWTFVRGLRSELATATDRAGRAAFVAYDNVEARIASLLASPAPAAPKAEPEQPTIINLGDALKRSVEQTIKMNTDPKRLRKLAAIEDGCNVSVGGLMMPMADPDLTRRVERLENAIRTSDDFEELKRWATKFLEAP